jgi:hypothetical protein
MSKGNNVALVSLTQIDGCWNLLSWSTTSVAGLTSYPYSEAAQGRIIFDISNRRMAAFMMHPEWKLKSGEQRMFLSYSAAIELSTDAQHGNVLLHHVDFASNPRMIGETLRRQARLEGDVLTLKTLTTVGREPKDGQHTLVWQRAATF